MNSLSFSSSGEGPVLTIAPRDPFPITPPRDETPPPAMAPPPPAAAPTYNELMRRIDLATSGPFNTFFASLNSEKNRYPDVLPTDEHRVQLQHRLSPDGFSDYINASHFSDMIITQGPLASTVQDFWTMLFEQNVTRIVCLANHEEFDLVKHIWKEKCYPYWNPSLLTPQANSFNVGDTVFSHTIYKDATAHELRVTLFENTTLFITKPVPCTESVQKRTYTIQVGNDVRQIELLQYINWKDHQAANPEVVRDLCQVIASGGKTCIHCSAGLGRSGVVATVSHLFKNQLPGTEQNILKTITTLREARPGAVMNALQLECIFKTMPC